MRDKVSIFVWTLAFLALALSASSAEVIDRIVATVNGQIILQSDWEDALRYEAFSSGRPLDHLNAEDRKAALDHLIDQELLHEQLRAPDSPHASPEEVAQRVAEIRKQYLNSESETHWHALLQSYGLSEEDLKNRVASQIDLMTLVDSRLRPAVNIDNKSIESYYQQELLPQLHQSGGQSVPLAEVSGKIKELLTQKKITQMLTAWLQNLRAGSQIKSETLMAVPGGRGQ
jgi:peptidyl-prolyl cis-trans isomerase SurA